MPRGIDELRGREAGRVAYIIGTGPSRPVFPAAFLDDQLKIGLNQVWRQMPLDYCVTVKTVSNYTPFTAAPGACVEKWVIRDAPGVNLVPEADNVYRFWASEAKRGNWDALGAGRQADELFYWGGSQTAAMHLAVLLGCSAIVLVGVDCCALGEDMHFTPRTDIIATKESRQRLYGRYRDATRALRGELRKRFGIPTLALTPFVGLSDIEEDYNLLVSETGRERLIKD